ncbi:MAG: HEAT repeat domain-containing protein [Planctomycetota bacterium]|nr:HEAT repeat domain-containing protein [Planctomycetota bacterium]
MRRVLIGAPLLWVAACGVEGPAARADHRPVVAEALAELDALLAAEEREPPAPPAAVEPEHLSGLVRMLAYSSGRARELPLEEVRLMGAGATPLLAAIAAEAGRADEERAAACELLAVVGGDAALEQLLTLFERASEGWLRANAAYALERAGSDWVIPRVIARLKYEKHPEAIVWAASCLSSLGNHAGLEALWGVRNTAGAADPALLAAVDERLGALAAVVGVDQPDEHLRLWASGDPTGRLGAPVPSARLRRAAWERISQLSGEHFQLRGVDDARFVLARLGIWIVDPLCRALGDSDRYVRVHAAQCLERMGARAVSAGPALVRALGDPDLATEAAAALGSVAYPEAEPALRALLAPRIGHERRVAAARSLGRLGLADSTVALEALIAPPEPLDLRQAAATALVALGAGDRIATTLLALLEDEAADRALAEASVETWLASRPDAAARTLLERWRALAPPPGIIPRVEQVAERQAARSRLLAEALDGLLGG